MFIYIYIYIYIFFYIYVCLSIYLSIYLSIDTPSVALIKQLRPSRSICTLGHFGVTLDHFGVSLGSLWGILGSLWVTLGHLGVALGSIWGRIRFWTAPCAKVIRFAEGFACRTIPHLSANQPKPAPRNSIFYQSVNPFD